MAGQERNRDYPEINEEIQTTRIIKAEFVRKEDRSGKPKTLCREWMHYTGYPEYGTRRHHNLTSLGCVKITSRIFKAKASLEENYDTLNSLSEVLGINTGRDLKEACGKLKLKRG